jgi:anti-sigma regulatory factor (Ser/Thr protein kinase)
VVQVVGDVRLVVPAMPAFLRLVRLTAASLGSRMGFTYDDVEDLRIAIDELCFSLVGSKGREGNLVLHYSMGREGLVVIGTGHFDNGPGAKQPALSELSEQILNAVVDEHEITLDGDMASFRLVKRHAG